MNRLFDDKDRYTDISSELDYNIGIFLREIIKSYMSKGYSVREIGYVLFAAVDTSINECILESRMNNSDVDGEVLF